MAARTGKNGGCNQPSQPPNRKEKSFSLQAAFVKECCQDSTPLRSMRGGGEGAGGKAPDEATEPESNRNKALEPFAKGSRVTGFQSVLRVAADATCAPAIHPRTDRAACSRARPPGSDPPRF